MRLRERDLVTVYLKRWQEIEDDEGNSIKGYSNEAIELKMNVQSAGGQIAATLYGSELPYVKACKYQGEVVIQEKDGICLYTKPLIQPLTLEDFNCLVHSLVRNDDSINPLMNKKIISPNLKPDYEVISIQPYSTHLNITLKRI